MRPKGPNHFSIAACTGASRKLVGHSHPAGINNHTPGSKHSFLSKKMLCVTTDRRLPLNRLALSVTSH